MEKKNFIITLTGPSQSGKSLLMKKILQLGINLGKTDIAFSPKIIIKYTTRYLRWDEEILLQQGRLTDVEHVQQIPEACDLVYQSYGIRYGIETKVLSERLKEGQSPIIIINDIRAVEELRKCFSGQVLSLFLFRKIPELEDFKREAQNRGNVSEAEVVARYEKAVAIYRTYIENIVLFDNVILNSIEYERGEEQTQNTILDLQLKNLLVPIIQGQKNLRSEEMVYSKSSRIFVIAGNAASGKDEIIRALLSMGKLQAKVLSKYTMRQQEPADGKEMICQYVPKNSYLSELKKEYNQQRERIAENLNRMDEKFKTEYKEEFLVFQRQLEEKNQNEYVRFWKMISEKLEKKEIDEKSILDFYFQVNSQYVDLSNIKKTATKLYDEYDAGIYEKDNKIFLIYGNETKLYGCDITDLENILNKNIYHLVIAASQIEVVNILKKRYGEDRVRLIYAHSEISAGEFEANATDITKKDKKEEFKKILDAYTKEIANYNHVTIYAKSQLTYEQTSKEEELVDQMFRILRAY